MTTGAAYHPNDANRSLPPTVAAELLALPGAVSLRPEDTGARDFQDTADLIAGLDLVITVDTAVAHLAASLGKPTWILLPAAKTDWRWQKERTDSPWYPSVRLFRQGSAGDWAGVIAQVRTALEMPR
jgi:ADP-heptose:LPS heptosyltransferase